MSLDRQVYRTNKFYFQGIINGHTVLSYILSFQSLIFRPVIIIYCALCMSNSNSSKHNVNDEQLNVLKQIDKQQHCDRHIACNSAVTWCLFPGYLDSYYPELGFRVLSESNPQIVMNMIIPVIMFEASFVINLESFVIAGIQVTILVFFTFRKFEHLTSIIYVHIIWTVQFRMFLEAHLFRPQHLYFEFHI